MVKRLLAFVLTAALIVETPATAYAAEQTPVSEGGGVETGQDLTEEGDETDTPAQDETEIGDTGDSISDEDADDSAADTDTGVEDSDAADGTEETPAAEETDEAGNTADGDAADDMEGDAASEITPVYADEGEVTPLSAVAESVKLVPSGDGVSAAAYSFNDTFSVALGEDAAEGAVLADSYNLRMILNELKIKYPTDEEGGAALDEIVLDASNNYAKALCSSDLYYEGYGGELFPLQLRPNTQYTLNYYLSWIDSENESQNKNAEGTITFTTAAANMTMDPVAVADNKLPIEVQLGTANTADLKGQTVSLSAYLREYKDGAEYSKLPGDAIAFTSENSYTQTINVDITDLKPDVMYELALGVDGNVEADEAAVIVYDTCTFTTPAASGDEGDDPKEDDREIKVTSVEPKVTSVTINYTLSGSLSSDDFVICYYKAKDAQSWIKFDYYWGDDYWPFTITDLSPETAYEYKIGFGSTWNTPADELAKSVQDGFTTVADQRILSDAEAEFVESGRGPRIRLNALFSGNTEQEYTCIHYFYREQAGTDAASAQPWNHSDEPIETYSVKRYCSQYIDGIKWGKTYEYAIVISDDYYLSSPDAVTKEGWKLTGTVEVPAATAPTSVTLSQEELFLNLNGYGEGCRYQTVKVNIEPADAAKELVFTNSDTSVASVYYYGDGSIRVLANGVGTAKITVKSPYSDTASAEINVEVANYAVFAKYGDTLKGVSYVAYPKFTDGKYIVSEEEYLLCKVESGTVTPVDNYTVTSENESIVTWRADERKLVTGKSVGTADLVFTDGKFKARLTVNTYATAKAFDITGLISESGYDAIEKDGVYTIANAGYYEAVVKVSPSSYSYDYDDFNWSSSNTSVATVSNGYITPVGAGKTTITATTTITDIDKKALKPVTIEIEVVDIPEVLNVPDVYVLANTVTKLSDVKCPDGWEWKVPNTPIVTNAVNSSPYRFDAVYTKGDKYPIESEINVYIAQVTGMSVFAYDDSDAVLEVAKSSMDAENDLLTLTVKTDYRGRFDASTKENGYEDYQIEIPNVTGLSITPVDVLSSNGSQQFTIKAERAGSFTLKPAIYVKDAQGNKKQLATSVYKLKAVDAALAESIEIRLTEEAKKNPSIQLDEYDRLYIDVTPSNEDGAVTAGSVQDFDVEAILKDWKDAEKIGESATTVTSDSLKATKLTWKVSDTKVATVKADSADSQKAKVTVKGEGHTILTATAKDAAGHSAQLKIEIRNHAPRVNVSKVTVNTAFDYDSYYGLENAQNAAGSVEIIPVYGESVKSVQMYEGGALSSSLEVYQYSGVYVIGTKSAGVSVGKKTAELRVTTSTNKTYKYPIQVTVVNKPARITAKSVNTVNLFFTDDVPRVSFIVSGTDNGISSVTWTDKSTAVGNGFSTNWVRSSWSVYYASQEKINLTEAHKLSDADIVKGEFTVKLNGYRDAYTVPATIKWTYKKPVIITSNYNGKAMASTPIEPSAGIYYNGFYLYDKTNKRTVYNDAFSVGQRYYNDLICNNRNVELNPRYSYVDYEYTGSKTSGSEIVEFKLASNVWREDITVKHTIKLVRPTAALNVSQIVINTKKPAVNYTRIYLKNSGYALDLSDIKVEGKDAKSTKLLEDDLLEISQDYEDPGRAYVRQNDAKIMGKDPIKAGTYSYKLTPYYTDNSGSRKALNTVILKVKVVNKDITVKAKVKNTLDLVKGTEWCNYMEITPVFSNIGTDYSVDDVKLTGEYSKYFTFDNYYDYSNGYRRLKISPEGVGKLKAGQSYKLTLEYTVSAPEGDTFTVKAAPITVKPKQMAPKVKVYNDNQTIYAGEENAYRTYTLVTDTYKMNGSYYRPYQISGVSGSLDCNKDGRADIMISKTDNVASYSRDLSVRIVDRDGVLTATGAKGKTYSVPVTVTLIGRDGISRDVKTTIKVTVKR